MDNLYRLAELIKARNVIDNDIAALIGRPALIGHVGEYIAAAIFEIVLEKSATHKSSDGHFKNGPLAGRTVNIKWLAKRENILDLTPTASPDFYLALTGPKSKAISSLNAIRPWVIESVFLFDTLELIDTLQARGVKLGVATSIISQLWDKAEIHPKQRNSRLTLSDEQRRLLDLFGFSR